MLVAAATVFLVIETIDGPTADDVFVLAPVAFAGLGAIIATRDRGNRIAWVFFIVGVGLVLEPFANLRLEGPPQDPNLVDVLAVAALNSTFFIGFLIPVALILFLFPTGRFLTARWSWAGWFAGAITTVILFVSLFATEVGPDNESWTISNPVGFHSYTGLESSELLSLVFGNGLLSLLLGGVVAISIRFRRSDRVVRDQIKWLALSTSLWVGVVIYRMISDDRGVASSVLFGIATLLIPISITVAIVRHRLFDIDRLISRTVGYGIVIVLLGLFYSGLVFLPGLLIGGSDGTDLTEAPPVLVAASTLAAVALFNPLRRRVIAWVDRRFHRSRFDAEMMVARFGDRVSDEVDIDTLGSGSLAVVTETLQPQSVGLWIRGENPPIPPSE